MDEITIKDKTTVPMKKVSRDRVRSYGRKGESWDSLANRIMDELEADDKIIASLEEKVKILEKRV